MITGEQAVLMTDPFLQAGEKAAYFEGIHNGSAKVHERRGGWKTKATNIPKMGSIRQLSIASSRTPHFPKQGECGHPGYVYAWGETAEEWQMATIQLRSSLSDRDGPAARRPRS